MNNPVIIKGNKWGIHIIIQPEATLDIIIKELENKLRGTRSYYIDTKPINVAFEGKILTDDEKEKILYIIRSRGLNVSYKKISNIDKTKKLIHEKLPDKEGLFYKGTLKNGQSINALCSIVIIGDVEKGASVYSNGNIVITGALRGFAKAGCDGREDAFVYSLISGRNL